MAFAAPLPKRKRCRVCRSLFVPRNSLAVVCGWECGKKAASDRKLMRTVLGKARRVEKREGKERLRTVSDWTKLAQFEFNKFIRLRDKNLPCISCDRFTEAKRNAGHYLSVGSHPELRFCEDNCHAQCEHCNSYKSGNATAYRARLIRRVGEARVEWLEGPHEPKRYRIDDLRAIRDEYRRKAREIQ